MWKDARPHPRINGAAPPARTPAGPACEHAVQFYQDERYLSRLVTSFLSDGLSAGQPLVVIARPQRLRAFTEGLASNGHDADRARSSGRLVLMDASEVLPRIMHGRMPDERRFESVVGGIIEGSLRAGNGRGARAYGEMVDVLLRHGNAPAAIRLEELWNELARTHSFSLLCAYAMGSFYREPDLRSLLAVCAEHTQVLPAETYTPDGDPETRARQVAVLQQRARALENEVRERRKLEEALRESLAERRRTEKELRVAKEEAERASRAKSEFLAVMSHELRTPLNAIVGYKDLLEQEVGGPLNPRQRSYIGRIDGAADQLLRLIDQILNLSRIEAGREELRLEAVDLTEVVRQTGAMMQPLASSRGLDMEIRSPAGPFLCETDEGKVRQILLNLMSNAVKFTERGRIDVELRPDLEVVEVEVSDTGSGIGADDLVRIFEPFVQGDGSATRLQGGAGLGLSVSRSLARLLGGDLLVASTPGEGSRFTLSLPADVVEEPVRSAAAGD